MKMHTLFQKVLFIAMIIGSGLILNSCTNDALVVDQSNPNEAIAKTRATTWHWRCPKCGFLNSAWRDNCANCNKSYSPEHGELIMDFLQSVADKIEILPGNAGGGIGGQGDDRLIQLPGNMFPARAPEPWYESAIAIRYYNKLKNSDRYFVYEDYAEGVEFGWYRTVRSLYPKITSKLGLDMKFDKWSINAGRFLKGQNGQGIKDGAKAAVTAFIAY